MPNVKVFGADWCPMTMRTLEHLKNRGVKYDYIDIEKDPHACEWVKEQNDGKERKPTLNIDGTILSEPSNDDVDEVLARAA